MILGEEPLSGISETFLTENLVQEETKSEAENKKENDSIDQQNSVYRSLETLYDLTDTSQYGYKLLYLSHLIDYEGNFSAHFQKDPEAPKFLEPSKDIDLKFSREALEGGYNILIYLWIVSSFWSTFYQTYLKRNP